MKQQMDSSDFSKIEQVQDAGLLVWRPMLYNSSAIDTRVHNHPSFVFMKDFYINGNIGVFDPFNENQIGDGIP